jgi:hypothetical protein
MPDNGHRLTRQERLVLRRLIAVGATFEEAAKEVSCATKTVQRLLNTWVACHRARRSGPRLGCPWTSGRRFRSGFRQETLCGQSLPASAVLRQRSLERWPTTDDEAVTGLLPRTGLRTGVPADPRKRS